MSTYQSLIVTFSAFNRTNCAGVGQIHHFFKKDPFFRTFNTYKDIFNITFM